MNASAVWTAARCAADGLSPCPLPERVECEHRDQRRNCNREREQRNSPPGLQRGHRQCAEDDDCGHEFGRIVQFQPLLGLVGGEQGKPRARRQPEEPRPASKRYHRILSRKSPAVQNLFRMEGDSGRPERYKEDVRCRPGGSVPGSR